MKNPYIHMMMVVMAILLLCCGFVIMLVLLPDGIIYERPVSPPVIPGAVGPVLVPFDSLN